MDFIAHVLGAISIKQMQQETPLKHEKKNSPRQMQNKSFMYRNLLLFSNLDIPLHIHQVLHLA